MGMTVMEASEADRDVPETKRCRNTILGGSGERGGVEGIMHAVFAFCAAAAVLAVAFLAMYIITNGIPALLEVGWKEILFETSWMPTAVSPRFGILYVVLTSLGGTVLAVALGIPVGILTAVFLAEFSGRKAAGVVRCAVELLAGVPSVIYGLLGVSFLNPMVYKLELRLFAGSDTHQFTGGANFLSAVLVLAVMILPTVISVSEASIRAVRPGIREASLALGASKMQTVFRSVLPAAKPGIMTAVILGVGRAVGEAMAITLVSGGSVNAPFPFHSVRFLTTAIVGEMGYAQGTHRQVLFTIGMVLFGFIMLVNMVLGGVSGAGAEH